MKRTFGLWSNHLSDNMIEGLVSGMTSVFTEPDLENVDHETFVRSFFEDVYEGERLLTQLLDEGVSFEEITGCIARAHATLTGVALGEAINKSRVKKEADDKTSVLGKLVYKE